MVVAFIHLPKVLQRPYSSCHHCSLAHYSMYSTFRSCLHSFLHNPYTPQARTQRGFGGVRTNPPFRRHIPLITVRKLCRTPEASPHARRILHGPVHDAQRGYADYRSVLNCECGPAPQGRPGWPWPPQFLASSPKITISPSPDT